MTTNLPHKSVTEELTIGVALKAFGKRLLARMAGYKAAYPTPTTPRTGPYTGERQDLRHPNRKTDSRLWLFCQLRPS